LLVSQDDEQYPNSICRAISLVGEQIDLARLDLERIRHGRPALAGSPGSSAMYRPVALGGVNELTLPNRSDCQSCELAPASFGASFVQSLRGTLQEDTPVAAREMNKKASAIQHTTEQALEAP
jgi:hypothetical protein